MSKEQSPGTWALGWRIGMRDGLGCFWC